MLQNNSALLSAWRDVVNPLTIVAVAMVLDGIFSVQALGQDDAVYRLRSSGGASKVGGKISDTSPFEITVQTSSGEQQVPVWEIGKVVVRDEALEIGRARERYESGRFGEVLEELGKLQGATKNPVSKQDVDFLAAAARAQMSLTSGEVSAIEAGKAIRKFLDDYPSSYHFFPATQLQAKLFWAINRPDLAEATFAALVESRWPELVLEGNFYRGLVQNELGQYDAAQASFQAIVASPENDDLTQSYKLLAQTQLARTAALAGNPDSAIADLEKIIKFESPDKTRLFAYAYNALGTAHLKAGRLKDAALAFLHTDLLFAKEAEPHAEALYQLALIWPQLEQTDRAGECRQTLKSRYRNSYWASKL